jgi:hypothetical protein
MSNINKCSMEASLFILNLHCIRFLDISDAIEKISLESLTGYQDAWFLSSIFSSYLDNPMYCFNIPHSSLYIRWNNDSASSQRRKIFRPSLKSHSLDKTRVDPLFTKWVNVKFICRTTPSLQFTELYSTERIMAIEQENLDVFNNSWNCWSTLLQNRDHS